MDIAGLYDEMNFIGKLDQLIPNGEFTLPLSSFFKNILAFLEQDAAYSITSLIVGMTYLRRVSTALWLSPQSNVN